MTEFLAAFTLLAVDVEGAATDLAVRYRRIEAPRLQRFGAEASSERHASASEPTGTRRRRQLGVSTRPFAARFGSACEYAALG
jgi:hypothetical protein